jgi:hypothetical protein
VESEAVVSDKGEKTVEAGNFVLASSLGWIVNKTVVSGSVGTRVIDEIVMLAGGPELLTCEVTISGSPEEIVLVGIAELASAPVLVAVEGIVSKPLWEKLGTVRVTVELVSAE